MKLLNPDGQGGNGAATSWLDTLPPELKSDESLKTIPDVPTLAKNYVESRKFIGTKRFEMPAPNWDEKKWGEFYAAAGRPETPDKYPNSDVKLPESIKVDEATLKGAKESLHKLGLSANQAKGVQDFYFNFIAQQEQAAVANRTKAMGDAEAKLKADWGTEYDKKLGLVKKAYDKFGTPEFEKELIDSGFGNNPRLIQFMANIGATMLEDSAAGRGPGALDPQDSASAIEEISRLKKDAKFNESFLTAGHADHKASVEKWNALHKRGYGNTPVGQA